MAACDEMGMQEILGAKKVEKLQQFKRWLEDIHQRCHRSDPIKVIRNMLHDMDYDGWLQQNAATPAAAERAVGNVELLLESLARGIKQAEEDNEAGDDTDSVIEKAINCTHTSQTLFLTICRTITLTRYYNWNASVPSCSLNFSMTRIVSRH